jgi:tetratricopeptide (TPR) repeat protein
VKRIAVAVLAFLGACGTTKPSGPYSPPSELSRETALAEELSREAAELMETDLTAAERLLREALAADLFFGPAHNNLGVVFLKQGKRYEAANEFEWAKKLMPAHPDPRVNLAMTLEEAGKVDDAIASYTAALEVYPGYLPAVQGIARVTLRAGREDERLPEWLEAIAGQSEDPSWRDWALRELARGRG